MTLVPNQESGLSPNKLFIWGEQALLLGELVDLLPHQHYAIQIIFGLTKSFKLHTEAGVFEQRAVILNSNFKHTVDSQGDWQAIMLLSPEEEATKRIAAAYLQDKDVAVLDDALVRPIIIELMDAVVPDFPVEYTRQIFANIVDRLSKPLDSISGFDSRIQNVLDMIHEHPSRKFSAGEIAEEIHLSKSRMIHLFKEQVGVPFRRYLLWHRLLAAINSLSTTEDLTSAAHDAGFADSAHLSRTFKDMFGVPPSEIFKDSQFIQAIFYLQD
jgi:AraC-like DNA-binding protein